MLGENRYSSVKPSGDLFLSEVDGYRTTFGVLYITDVFSTQPRQTVLLWLKYFAGAWESVLALWILSNILGLKENI